MATDPLDPRLLQADNRQQLVQDILRRAGGLASGAGTGLKNQALGLYDMVRHPVDTATGLYEAGKAVVANPKAAGSAVVTALRDTGRKAMASPEG